MRRVEKEALREQTMGNRIGSQVARDVASGAVSAYYGGGGSGMATSGEPSLGGTYDGDGNFVPYFRAGWVVGTTPVKGS